MGSRFPNTGMGAGSSTSTDVVLKIDGGNFDAEVGYPNGAATAYFVNRLTPPSYPATIKSVQIFFSAGPMACNARREGTTGRMGT